jgi:hypothetical protein
MEIGELEKRLVDNEKKTDEILALLKTLSETTEKPKPEREVEPRKVRVKKVRKVRYSDDEDDDDDDDYEERRRPRKKHKKHKKINKKTAWATGIGAVGGGLVTAGIMGLIGKASEKNQERLVEPTTKYIE